MDRRAIYGYLTASEPVAADVTVLSVADRLATRGRKSDEAITRHVALALHPDGLSAEQLALLLYGEEGNPTTVRGEVLRLRGLIGSVVLRTRPYRPRTNGKAERFILTLLGGWA